MAKYKIAWMPGDGVGNDVMEAARIVLDRMKLDAEYVLCDIGWDFWGKEGNALPDRTVKALKETTCGLFGAITSKPRKPTWLLVWKRQLLASSQKAKCAPMTWAARIPPWT